MSSVTKTTALSPLRAVLFRLDIARRVAAMIGLFAIGTVSRGVWKRAHREMYQLISLLAGDSRFVFLNYGYLPVSETGVERAAGLASQQATQSRLYHHVAGAVDLKEKDVIEVGCGRGGGSAYVMNTFAPRSMVGVDLAPKAVAFCRRRHAATPGLSFQQGDAEHLPFPPESFDAVLNVESSHCYPSMEGFLREVVRVLKPHGHLLFADFRKNTEVDTLRAQFRSAGLVLELEERITADVLRARDFDSEYTAGEIESCPRRLREPLRQFAALKDSSIYNMFRTGEREYLRFVLQKPGPDSPATLVRDEALKMNQHGA